VKFEKGREVGWRGGSYSVQAREVQRWGKIHLFNNYSAVFFNCLLLFRKFSNKENLISISTIFLQGFSGTFCEFDSAKCLKNPDTQLVCSGPEQGYCEAEKCICRSGWTGDRCECSTNTDPCYDYSRTQICSGKGDCKCGACVCHQIPSGGRYTGKHCDDCPVFIIY
jgi:hypothetical protein